MAIIHEGFCWCCQIRGWVRMMWYVGEEVVKKVQIAKTASLLMIDADCEHMIWSTNACM